MINHVGEDNIKVDILRHNLKKISSKQNMTSITFTTHESNLSADDVAKNKGKVGLVLWLDADAVEDWRQNG